MDSLYDYHCCLFVRVKLYCLVYNGERGEREGEGRVDRIRDKGRGEGTVGDI